MTPVKAFCQYIVVFQALPETISMSKHFVAECGFCVAELRKIRNYKWFCARVSLWRAGKELANEYLGCCCYKTAEEFYTTYEGDYFADMVRTCALEIGDAELLTMVNQWHEAFRLKLAA